MMERLGLFKKHVTAARLLLVPLLVAAVWYGSARTGSAQPADVPAPGQGRVEGGNDVLALGTAATGTVAEVLVTAGEHVQAGQHLVRIECSSIERELEARKSDLAAAETVLLRVVHGPRPEEVGIGIANVNLAEARLTEAQRSLQRTQQLHEGFTVTRVQIDQVERDARMAAAQLEEMRARLALLKAGSREEDITEARDRRDAAKSRMDEAAAQLGYCSVNAPTGGVVLTANVTAGQLVSTAAPATLLTMVDDGKRRVRTYVDERDVTKLCLRQRTHITAEGVPGIQVDGAVDSIGATIVDNPLVNVPSRQFRQVMVALADVQPQVPIGLRVSVQFSPCTASQRPPGK